MSMIRKHSMEAFVGDLTTSLGEVASGSISLDSVRAPLVKGEIVISTPDQATRDLLDPRMTPRVLFQVSDLDGDPIRTFDLSLRSRPVDQGDAEVRLSVASDEALLADYGPLEDIDLIDYAGDLGALCEQVILEALGETVTVDGVAADVTPYWPVTNLHPNPLPASATGYNIAAAGTALTFTALGGANVIRWTSSAPTSNLNMGSTSAYRATPGKTYHAEIDWASASSGRSAALVMEFRSANGTVLMSRTTGVVTPYAAVFQTLAVEATAPAGTETVYVYITTTGNAAATMHYVKRFILAETDFPVGFFYGGSSDANYTYEFTDVANASPSTRTPVVERARESVVWPAGRSALDFLHPLVQASGLRLLCDETRAWTLRGATFTEPGSMNIRYGVNMLGGADVIDRDAGLWYDAAVTIYRWLDKDGIQRQQVDAFALNTPHTRMMLFEKDDTPYPGPGFSEYAVLRAQARGREVTATKAADWSEAVEQIVSVVLPDTPTQVGGASSLTFDLDLDQVEVVTRTVDTPEDAWLLQPADDSWTDGDPDETWLEAA